jgi:hypothetical protein
MRGRVFHKTLLAVACLLGLAPHGCGKGGLGTPARTDSGDGSAETVDTACIPTCAGRKCGEDDGCGTICRTCPEGNQCVRDVSGYTCICDPRCLTDTCGELNGCGLACRGMCPDADAGYGELSCSNYARPSDGKWMMACVPDQACVGKLCGETVIGLPSPNDPAPVFSCYGSCPNGRTCRAEAPAKFSWFCQ